MGQDDQEPVVDEQTEALFAEDETTQDDVASGDVEGGDGGEGDGGEEEEPATLRLDPASLQALGQIIRQPAGGQQQQQQQQPPLDPAQVKEVLGQFDITEDVAEELGLPPAAAPALSKLRDRIVRQAARTVGVYINHIKQQLETQMAPALRQMQQQEQQAIENEFYGQHKDLATAKELVMAVYQQHVANGTDFRTMSRKEAFKLVADGARALHKRLTGSAGQQQRTPNGKKPTMLAGGRSGGKRTGGARGNMSEAEQQARALFD